MATSSGDGIYAFRRELTGEASVLVVLNTATSDRTVVLDPGFPAGTMTDGVSGRVVNVPAVPALDLTMPRAARPPCSPRPPSRPRPGHRHLAAPRRNAPGDRR